MSQPITKLVESINEVIGTATIEEKIEMGATLWELSEKINATLESLKKEIRDEAQRTSPGAGEVKLNGLSRGMVVVTTPKPSVSLVKGADVPTLKSVMDYQFSHFFEENTTYKVRPGYEERVTNLSPDQQQEFFRCIELKDNTPRVSFKVTP